MLETPPPNTAAPASGRSMRTGVGGQGWVSALGVSVDCIPCGWKTAPRALWGMCLCVSALVCVGAFEGAHVCLPGSSSLEAQGMATSPRSTPVPMTTNWFIITRLFLDTHPILFDSGVDLVATPCLFTMGFPYTSHWHLAAFHRRQPHTLGEKAKMKQGLR